jgi:beta-mannanase
LRQRLALLGCAVALLSWGLLVSAPPAGSTSLDPKLFGAYAATRNGETKVQAFENLQDETGWPFSIVRIFYSWNSSYPDSLAKWAASNNKTPVISVKTHLTNGTAVSWAAIASSQPGSSLYDQMVTWANRMKSYPGTVYFCFDHEPSNHKSTESGTSSDYKAAWHKIHDVFALQGVTNVEWTWIMGDPTPWEVKTTDPRYAYKWYPGDAYTDVLSVDVYNWNCGGSVGRTFASLTQKFLAFVALHPKKETLLAEFGTNEVTNDPNGKATWVNDMHQDLKSWPNLVGAMVFHSHYGSSCLWWIDSSQAALNAFSAMGADTYFGGTG